MEIKNKLYFHIESSSKYIWFFLGFLSCKSVLAADLFTPELQQAKSEVINWFQVLGSALFMINLLLLIMCHVSPFEMLHNMKSKVTKAFFVTLMIYILSSVFSGTIGQMINAGSACPLMLLGGSCQ